VPLVVLFVLGFLASHYFCNRTPATEPGRFYLRTQPSGANVYMLQAGSVSGVNKKFLGRSPGPFPISLKERTRFTFIVELFGFEEEELLVKKEELSTGTVYPLTSRWGGLGHLLYFLRDNVFLLIAILAPIAFWLLRIRPQIRSSRAQEALWTTGRLEVGMMFHQYRLLELLGEGAAGAVYKADRPGEKNDGYCTLKIFHRKETGETEHQISALKREFQNSAELSHPNIVYLLDWGIHRGYYYLVSEFIDGVPLDKATGYTLTDVCRWGVQLAAALGHAHSQGVVHRDIKPANVLLTGDNRVKVLDFGIAARIESSSEHGAGSIGYMAPEQAGGTVAPASDFYSLGVTLYRLATGEMPFQGDDYFQILAAQGLGNYKPLRDYLPQCPIELQEAVDQLLKKEPSERLTDPARIRSLLEKAVDQLQG